MYLKTLTPERQVSESGYRFYSPTLGRWLSRDPIEEGHGQNVYAFVGNRPIRWIDLLGLIPVVPDDPVFPAPPEDTDDIVLPDWPPDLPPPDCVCTPELLNSRTVRQEMSPPQSLVQSVCEANGDGYRFTSRGTLGKCVAREGTDACCDDEWCVADAVWECQSPPAGYQGWSYLFVDVIGICSTDPELVYGISPPEEFIPILPPIENPPDEPIPDRPPGDDLWRPRPPPHYVPRKPTP